MNYKKLLFLLYLIFSINLNYSFANDKILYLNVNFIINNSNLGKNVLNKLNKINDENQKKILKMENELKNKENEIIKLKNIISENELNNKINLLNNDLNNYKKLKEKINFQMKNSREKEIKFFFEQINPLIEDYMNNNSVGIIIDQKNIFIAKSEYDITKEILDLVNKNFK